MTYPEYLLLYIFNFILLINIIKCNTCHRNNLNKLFPRISLERNDNPEFILYGLTQDCQLFFLRPDQLDLLSHLTVQSRVTYCLPNLVQLHLRQHHQHGIDGTTLSLQLLFKRANNQICTLPIEFPSKNALSGFSIFSYSILSSLNYASCSYMTNSSFIMEPDLSFMDTSYSDVIYFVDPESKSTFWNVRQFKFDKNGYFKSLDSFIIKNIAEEIGKNNLCARDYLLILDGQRHKVFSIQRHNKVVSSTCAYDLLFRPSKTKIKKLNPLNNDPSQFRVNSLSSDGNHLLIGESHRINHDQFLTKLFISDQNTNDTSECILQVHFLAEFGFIMTETKETLEKIHLPHFGHRKIHDGIKNIKNDSFKDVNSIPKIPIEPLVKHQKNDYTKTTTRRVPTSTKRVTTTTTISPEIAQEDNDVGDGKILDSEEQRERQRGEDDEVQDDENNELGYMTEITTKDALSTERDEDKIEESKDLESSGDVMSSDDINKENLNSTANNRYSLYPVFIVFLYLF